MLVRGIGVAFIDVFFVCSALLLNSTHPPGTPLLSNSIIIVPAPPRLEAGSPAAQGFFLLFVLKILPYLQLGEKQGIQKEAMTEFRSLDTSIQADASSIGIGSGSGRQRLESSF